MSAATASVAEDHRHRNNSVQAQCTPVPLPALGKPKIIQGNGTNVGTVISLQCPAKHKLLGGELTCVMQGNVTRWDGETYCAPLTPHENYGFQVAVVASIVSSAIILVMSVAFITCCWVDCLKESKRKKQERESELCHWEEQVQHPQDYRSHHYNHKGRNNNNNTQEKTVSLWDTHNPALCDNMQACSCHQARGHLCAPRPATLPGRDYHQPLLPPNPDPAPTCGPPQYPGPPASTFRSASPHLVQISVADPGAMWSYGRQDSSLPGMNWPTEGESSMRNMNPAKEFSIRIISV